MSMSSSFLLVKVLIFAGLHLMYLAHSLVVVEYRSHASSGRGRLWQLQQTNNNNNHRFQTQSPSRAGVAFATASTTAIAFAPTENNSNNISDNGSSSSSSPPLSLKEILNELTVRGIAFSPLASKAELEELLKRKDNLDGYVAESRSSEPEDKNVSSQNDAAPSSTKQQPQHPPPSTSTETETTVPSASEGLGDGSEVRSNRNPRSNREGKRRIEDRLQRRTNGTRNSVRKETFGKENIAPGSVPPSPSSRQQRQQRQQRRRGGERKDDSGSDSAAGGQDEKRTAGSQNGASLRRRRRSQRLERKPPSLLDSISGNLPVTEMAGIGVRASRIARRKTGKLWKNLVDSTYDENYDGYDERYGGAGDDNDNGNDKNYEYENDNEYDTRSRQTQSRSSRRARRRSGFNWQQSSRPARVDMSQQQRRQRRKGSSSSSIDDRGNASASARKNKKNVDIEDDFDRFSDEAEDNLRQFGDFVADSVDTIFWGENENGTAPLTPPRSERNTGRKKQEPTNRRFEENEANGREESSRKQRREARQRRQQQQQQPFSDVNNQNKPSASARSKIDASAKTAFANNVRSGTLRGKLPIRQILAVLDARNIPYSPRASRSELEDLLEDLLLDGLGDNEVIAVKKAEEDIKVIEVESISPEDWKRQQEEKLQQKQNRKEREQEEELQKQKEKRQQKQTNSNLNSNNPGEERDPRPEPPNGSTATSSTSNFYRRSVNNSYRSSGFSTTAGREYGTGSTSEQRRKQQTRPEQSPRTAAAASAASGRSAPQSPENISASRQSGADVSGSSSRASRRAPSGGQESEERTGRRIYSPYGGQRPESAGSTPQSTRSAGKKKKKKNADIEEDFDRFSDVVEDDLGRFGDFVANSVDTIFWGAATDDENENEAAPSTPPRSERKSGRKKQEPTDRRNRGRSRKSHWKDRAEERLDKLLGVHKVGGKTYDRWSEKDTADTEEDEARGYDAISYTKGRTRPRSSRRRGKGKSKRRGPKKAFWEEDESILAVLLGHNWDDSRPPQRSLKSNLDDIREAFRSSHTLTVLLRRLLLVSARLVESLSRWASVRDTIPRSIVFLGAVGAGFVSRPGTRIKNALLVFLSFRVLGEWLSEPDSRESGGRPRRGRASEEEDDDCEDDE